MPIIIKFNRQDYIDGKCSHDEYYAQFVTKPLIFLVEAAFGREIRDSTDPYFNDILKERWDKLTKLMLESLPPLAKANGGGISLSDKVCVLKAAATMLKASYDAENKH